MKEPRRATAEFKVATTELERGAELEERRLGVEERDRHGAHPTPLPSAAVLVLASLTDPIVEFAVNSVPDVPFIEIEAVFPEELSQFILE